LFSIALREIGHLRDAAGASLIEPAENLTGSVAGPSEWLQEPTETFFCQRQEIGRSGTRWEGVILMLHNGTLP